MTKSFASGSCCKNWEASEGRRCKNLLLLFPKIVFAIPVLSAEI
jgi:hypothetical protein